MNTRSEPQLLKVSEAAALLHVSPQTVRDWTDQGKLDSFRTAGGHRLYSKPEVQLLSFKEKGIMSFWHAGINFSLTKPNEVMFLWDDYTYNPAPQFQPAEKVTLSLNSNGLFPNLIQLLVDDGESLVVTPVTYGNPDVLSAPLEVHTEPEGNRLSTFVEVYSFTKQGVQEKLESTLREAIAWVTKNVKPVYGVVSWTDAKGVSFPQY